MFALFDLCYQNGRGRYESAMTDRFLHISIVLFIMFFSISKVHAQDSTFIHNAPAEFQVYPNPVTDLLYIKSPDTRDSAILADQRGVIIGFIPLKGELQVINVSTLKPGTYVLIMNEETHRFVKE